MARQEQFSMTRQERQARTFSDEFKKQKVKEISRKLISIPELCKEYEVNRSAVYKWINQFSPSKMKPVKVKLETESDTRKLLELKERVKELERIIGQKQLLIDFQSKVIDLAEEEYKVDIKKKLGAKLFTGTGLTGVNTK